MNLPGVRTVRDTRTMNGNRTPAQREEAEKHRREIETYLLAEVRKGRNYFRSCDVSEATGMTAHTIGSNIAQLKASSSRLTIIRWSGSSSTVWKITEKAEKTKKPEETEKTGETASKQRTSGCVRSSLKTPAQNTMTHGTEIQTKNRL